MSSGEDLYLEVSREFVKNRQNFAMDIGGSAIKIAYLPKDQWEELKNDKKKTTAKLRMAIFLKEDLTDALQFVKDTCYLFRDGIQKPRIYMTGVGCQQYGTMIEKELNIKIIMSWEQSLVVKALCYLSKVCPQTEFEHSLSPECQTEMLNILPRIHDILSTVSSEAKRAGSIMRPSAAESLDLNVAEKIIEAKMSHLPVAEVFPYMFPCIRFQISSACGLIVIYPDGTYRMLSTLYSGGRSFVGLGQLVCGCQKTYDELIDLAEKGNNLNVDQTMEKPTGVSPLVNESSQQQYDKLYSDEVVYVLGQAAAKHPDAFKKEDLILAILHMMARNLTGLLQNMVLKLKVKHVVVVGSFFNRELVRSVFAQEFLRQKVILAAAFDGEGLDVHLHFVKMCAHLGALGALIASSEDEASTNIPSDIA